MRIVGGIHKGQRLISPKNIDVRPTLERVRESIFNILIHGLAEWSGTLKDATVLDLFCGTGALGIEALSRGATHVTFLDQSEAILSVAKRNASFANDTANSTTFLKLDATTLPLQPLNTKLPFNITFLDPPYGKRLATKALVNLKKKHWLAREALAVVETGVDEEFVRPSGYKVLDTRSLGPTQITFLQLKE